MLANAALHSLYTKQLAICWKNGKTTAVKNYVSCKLVHDQPQITWNSTSNIDLKRTTTYYLFHLLDLVSADDTALRLSSCQGDRMI